MRDFTVVIPYRNGGNHIKQLLDCIPSEIPSIVVDDTSDIPLQLDRATEIVRLGTRGYFSGAINAGIEACDTDVLILNQDSWLDEGWPDQVRQWQAVGYGIAGDGVMNHPAWPNGYVQGTCMYLSKDALEAVGPFNERDYPLWGATAEWQLRACRLGFKAHPFYPIPWFHHKRNGNYGESISETLRQEPDKQSLFIRTPPAISVVIACYNYGRYLQEAINSLLGGTTSLGNFGPQTFQSFEIVIANDASTDETDKIASGLVDAWRGIRYIKREKNGGTSACYNTGINAAYGKYITVLSADDMMESVRLERMYRIMESHPHSVVYDDSMLFKDGKRYEHFKLPEYDFDRIMYKNGMHSGIMYEKSAWQDVGGYPEVFHDGREDWAFNVALGVKGYCGVHIRQPLYLYRREGQNRTLTNSTPRYRVHFLGKLRGLFPKLYEGERPDMCCGSGGRRKSSSNTIAPGRNSKNSQVQAVIGEKGMTLLEYRGASYGPALYGGKGVTPTKQYYRFDAGRHKQAWVDNRDVDAMLAIREKGKPLFAVVKLNNASREIIKEADKIVSPPPPEMPPAPTIVESAPVPLQTIEIPTIDLVADPEADKPKRRYQRRKKAEQEAVAET